MNSGQGRTTFATELIGVSDDGGKVYAVAGTETVSVPMTRVTYAIVELDFLTRATSVKCVVQYPLFARQRQGPHGKVYDGRGRFVESEIRAELDLPWAYRDARSRQAGEASLRRARGAIGGARAGREEEHGAEQ